MAVCKKMHCACGDDSVRQSITMNVAVAGRVGANATMVVLWVFALSRCIDPITRAAGEH
ncbi:MAG TPA: hypothetical protein HPP54_10770 [Nitrospinae bacterium]|nr:hypothetical protein [Nitrospinota bacterium]